MKSLLVGAGFKLPDVQDPTDESQSFFEGMTAQMAQTGSPPWRGGCSLVKIFRNGTQSSSQRDRTSDQDRQLYLRRVTAPEPTRVNEWLMSVSGVRRAKAPLSSGCKPHPATAPAGSNRSSHGGNEVAAAFD